MRRARFPLAAACLLTALTVAAAPALAADDRATQLLAVEGTGTGTATATAGETAPGPDPAPPDASGNPAAPETYDPPFIWAASLGLLVMMVVLAVVVGGLYYLMVYRPAHRQPPDGG